MTKPRHQNTCDIQKSLSYFDSRKYIQRNLALRDALPAGRTTVQPLRSFEDGDSSLAHLDYVLGDWGPMIGFEVHRWENERIVEHWDNLQSTPAASNPSGRSMTDGSVAVTDLDHAELLQHNPSLPDGTEALAAALIGSN